MSTQNNGGSANLRPWKKGQSGNPGGLSKRVRAFRKECEKLLPEAAERLADLLRSGEPDDYKFALEWIRKAFIPVPKEQPAGAPGAGANAPRLRPEVAAALAAARVQ